MSNFLFVYGSLLRGLEHAEVLPANPRSPARTPGRLYTLPGERYPTLVDRPGWVVGDRVELSEPDRQLCRLDEFEGVGSGLYERVRRPVHAAKPDRSPVTAWVYLCPAGRAGAVAESGTPIPNGDWRGHLDGTAP